MTDRVRTAAVELLAALEGQRRSYDFQERIGKAGARSRTDVQQDAARRVRAAETALRQAMED